MDVRQIPGEYLIYPVQLPYFPGETIPWTEPDSTIYNYDDPYPANFIRIAGEGVLDGARLVTIEIAPLQYRPKSGRIFLLRNISFNFAYNGINSGVVLPQIRGRYEQMVYDAVIRQVVENENEVLLYYRRPVIVEENQLGGAAPYPVGPAVIITPDEFKPYFQVYADWMTDQGIRTVLISPQTIYAYFAGVDHAEQVRNYIKHCYQTAGGSYFILGGDDDYVPVRYGIPKDYPDYSIWENDSIPCDHYFADLTGNWNCDSGGPDICWGELTDDSADCYADVFVGRVTALDTTEVKNWVSKAIHYEQSPGVRFDEALWINDGFYNQQAHNKFPVHFSHRDCNSVYADVAFYAIDSGYAYVNLNCHGNICGFTPYHWGSGPNYRATIYNWWPEAPSQMRAGLNWFTNVNKYFFVYGISCHCGAFDGFAHTNEDSSDTCIADAFVDTYLYNAQGMQGPFGACAAVLQTRSPEYFWNELQTSFYDALFGHLEVSPDERSAYLGVALALSKSKQAAQWYTQWYYRHDFYCQNLFGSPVTEAWTKTPAYINVFHPTRTITGPQIFTVTVKTAGFPSVPIANAKVCLNKPGDVYEVGMTDLNGQAIFNIAPQYGGTMKITVTRSHNIESDYDQYYPSQTICEVSPAEGGEQSLISKDLIPDELCITSISSIIKRYCRIKFGVAVKGDITLALYNPVGLCVQQTVKSALAAGYYEEVIDLKDSAVGVYFIVVKQGKEKVSKKILLIK
ncbi:MAG TPA: hypothetical protein ENI34_09995 [candidate division WOR-3 bacterium]|uniref:Gingipain domain-containing protein n=1 Tax=candidate division WOR-3 bacterium TaxID=2052148 RepID=A0A9C9K113_UNCW3|nr:hypothetical protein [candidate division WOR-3 bacterium]